MTSEDDQVEESPAMALVAATDGSCLGNPGPGGWAWVTEDGQQDWASTRSTTNNRMELRAVYELLCSIPPEVELEIQTDSKYVLSIFTEWLPKWRERGMRTASNKPIENVKYVEAIDKLLQGRKVTFSWVKGHAGHELNEKADQLAQFAARRAKATVEQEASEGRTSSPST